MQQDVAVRAARGQGLPRVTLTGGAGKTKVEGIGTSQQNNVGVRVDVPIFSGFADRARGQPRRSPVLDGAE